MPNKKRPFSPVGEQVAQGRMRGSWSKTLANGRVRDDFPLSLALSPQRGRGDFCKALTDPSVRRS